jgi:hypothetical protein
VTLQGGHSLGHTSITNSGYGLEAKPSSDLVVLNAWDSTPSMLDNQYFARLVTQVLYRC